MEVMSEQKDNSFCRVSYGSREFADKESRSIKASASGSSIRMSPHLVQQSLEPCQVD